jgi:osmotically-inducible protein OsmY
MRVLRGMVLGAGIAYLFDPESGRGRRAKLIDRAGRLLREVRHLAARKTRFAAGRLRGLSAPLHQEEAPRATDDGTVLQRIRSEALRDVGVSTSEVDVTVSDGVAMLRGEVVSASLVDDLVDRVRLVPGVRDVDAMIRVGSGSAEPQEPPPLT